MTVACYVVIPLAVATLGKLYDLRGDLSGIARYVHVLAYSLQVYLHHEHSCRVLLGT